MNRLVLLVAAVVCVGLLASPVAAQQTTDTPTESGDETTPGGSDLPVESPDGTPITYESPTPTSSGSGPGFGAVGALVAVVLGTAAVARRRT